MGPDIRHTRDAIITRSAVHRSLFHCVYRDEEEDLVTRDKSRSIVWVVVLTQRLSYTPDIIESDN